MELLGDVALVESHFGSFRDGVSVRARQVHSLCQMYHRLRNSFGRTRWYTKLMRLKWKLVSVHLEIVLILSQDRVMSNLVKICLEMMLVSVQDRCMVCAKCRNHFGRT
jgi:hypothetical protein